MGPGPCAHGPGRAAGSLGRLADSGREKRAFDRKVRSRYEHGMTRTALIISADRDVAAADVLDVALNGRPIRLAPQTRRMLTERRGQIERYVREHPEERAYGFNTGFGHNVHLSVNELPDKELQAALKELQRSLIHSHASGVGPDADIHVIRATMVLRANSLARGHSAVRPVVVETLLALVNAGITPAVPRYGTVSASGDLAPLSHIALALLGDGLVYRGGKRMPARKALSAAGIEPVVLEMKEGLALNNGAQYSNALGILAAAKYEILLKTAAITTSLTTQVMLGADTPFRADLHALRAHAGAQRVASWIAALMKDSPLREAHRGFDVDGEVQDPYNIRCAAQVLGTCAELLARADKTFAIEANSVTDNPILLASARDNSAYVDIVSGGHFHAMPLAVDLYGLIQAAAMTAALVNVRCARYIDGKRNKGLGDDLKWPGDLDLKFRDDPQASDKRALQIAQAVSSAMMIPEYASAGLTNAIWGLAMPSHLFSISTDAGQEDHVSMASNVGLRLHDALDRLAEALAIELAFAYQAAAIRKAMRRLPSRAPDNSKGWRALSERECRLSPPGEALLVAIGRHFKVVKRDRSLAPELAAMAEAVRAGDFVRAAEAAGIAFGPAHC